MLKKRGSVLLLIALVISIAYLIYSVVYWGGVIGDASTNEEIGAGIAAVLVGPHLLLVFIGAIFNAVALLSKKRWAALTSGILYSAAALLFIPYFMFVIIQLALCFIAFVRMGEKQVQESNRFVEK